MAHSDLFQISACGCSTANSHYFAFIAGNDLCADNFTLFAISSAQGLEGLDGILGFSPVITDEPMVNNTNIVRGLFEAGLIDSEVATFQLNGENV